MSVGWNLIGSVFQNVDFSAPDTEPPRKVEPLSFWWNAGIRAYILSTTLEPGMGHWIAATEDCVLWLCCDA